MVKNESPFELVYKLEMLVTWFWGPMWQLESHLRTVICGDRGPPPFTFNPQTATVADTRRKHLYSVFSEANSSLNVAR